jgi:predicted metal-dependent hydrolase
MPAAKSSQGALIQSLQRALQLDFFNELFSNPTPVAEPSTKQIPPSARPNSPNSDAGEHPSGVRKRQILIQDQVLEYELRRSKRRSIGFLIGDDGLRMTAPRWVTIADIERAILEKQTWIIHKLAEKRERVAQRTQTSIRWEDGARLPYLGRDLGLKIVRGSRISLQHDAELATLTITLPPEYSEQELKDRVKSWLQQEAKRLFQQRMPIFAQRLGVTYHSLSLSSAGTRWGSCTSQGKIRLNWRLIHFSPELIDYVVAHELSHLREMNHSPAFWATVASIYPEYASAKQKLRQQATADLPVF